MTMMIRAMAISALMLASVPVKAEDTCGSNYLADYPADPLAVASRWLPQLEQLNAAIPALSPKEEKWLQEELMGESPERSKRAASSVEYAMQNAKQDAAALFGLMRLVRSDEQADQVRGWLLFTYTLIDPNAASRLARLVEDGVVQGAALPENWTLFSTSGSLDRSIRNQRANLARHVLICVLPQVTGTQMAQQ